MYDRIRNVQKQLELLPKNEKSRCYYYYVAVDFQEVNIRAIIDVYYQGVNMAGKGHNDKVKLETLK